MSYFKYYLFLIIIIIGFISFSCSKNSTGIADIDIDFPNKVSNHWTYEIEWVTKSELDTVDVIIYNDTAIADNSASLWSFDYHCVIDTIYIINGTDTSDTIITCIPPPDSCITTINADSVTLQNKSFFSFTKFVMRFPLSVGNKWNWDGDLMLREKHTCEVISLDTMTVKETLYNNAYEIRGYHEVGFFNDNYDYIKTVYWFVYGVGIIKIIENKIDYNETTHTEQYVEITNWELMDYSLAD